MTPTSISGKNSHGTLTSIVETAFKFAGAVAVFGYLSLRAHLNSLGIPMTRPLGTERYLMEAGNAISYLAMAGGLVMLGVLLIGIGVWLFSRLLSWSLRYWGWVPGIGRHLAHFCGTRWCPFLLLTAFILFWLWAALQIVRLTQQSAIGDLKSASGGTALGLFCLLLTICFAGYGACRWLPRIVRANDHTREDLVARELWILTGVVVVLVALLVPIMFGCCVRPAEYYRVELRMERDQAEKTTDTKTTDTKITDTTCGLLVFETDSNLFLWRVVGASSAQDATGSVEVIQRTQVRQMRVGPSQDLRNAIKEIKKNKTVELCPKTGGQL